MNKSILKTTNRISAAVLAIGLVGCTSSEPSQRQQPAAGATQKGILGADAVGNLVKASNLTATGPAGFARADAIDVGDLLADLEAELGSCFDGVLEDADTIAITYDGCLADGMTLDGEFSVSLKEKVDGLVVDFDGNIVVDGSSFDGSWSLAIGATGLSFSGNVSILHSTGASLSIEFDGSISDFDSACPTMTQSASVSDGQTTVTLDVDGLNLCEGICSGSFSGSVTDANGNHISLDLVDGVGTGTVNADSAELSCAGGEVVAPDASYDEVPADEEDPDAWL